MAKKTLTHLEAAQNAANQVYIEKCKAMETANQNIETADANYIQAMNNLYDNYGGDNMEELQSKCVESVQAKDKAVAAAEAAEASVEDSAAAAVAAGDAVAAKKEDQRQSRASDTNYVVYTARIECSFGRRESYLVLDKTHGVYTRQIPQMTIKDYLLNQNVIEFGGCKSKENPTLIAAAQQVVQEAKEQIEKKGDWRDDVVNFFTKEQEIEVNDSLLEQCIGECVAKFPGNATWIKGHENVTINGEAPMLRRCELTCNYGGQIIILLSGQPE